MPPPGFVLDHAVGTTFTLDLETALSVPLSLAAKRAVTDDDALSIMDALGRTEEHIDIFAQAGQITMANHSTLITLLERAVHPVSQAEGLFHPKVWFLRFTDAGAGDVARYRFICASRNLTQDRSWDTVVRLDGEQITDFGAADSDTTFARKRNASLAGLLRRLPGMAIRPLPAERAGRIMQLADDWETINWDLPDGVRELEFHVFGPGGGPVPDMAGSRTLIISPFVSDDGLRMLRGGTNRDTTLISRVPSLEGLRPESLDKRLSTHIFDDAADFDDDADPEHAGANDLLQGLHAKVVVHDRTSQPSQVFIGSANATWQGWHTNTEVMVELVGPRSRFGVQRVLDELGELNEEYEPEGGAEQNDREEAAFELEKALRTLATQSVTMRLDGNGPCDVAVWTEPPAEAPEPAATVPEVDARLEWQLLGYPEQVSGRIPVGADRAHVLRDVPPEQVTPFILVTAHHSGIARRTIVIARIVNDFEARRTAALTSHITDRAAFLRLLTMMLELGGFGVTTFAAGSGGFAGFNANGADSAGLMEALAKALGHGAEAINDVEKIVDFLQRDEHQAAEILPPGFNELWEAVMSAHEEVDERWT